MTGRRAVIGLLLGAAALLGYFTLAPRSFGGPVSYLVTAGNSMEPLIHADDLVVLRKAGPPKIGDKAKWGDGNSRRIPFRLLPADCQKLVIRDYVEIWGINVKQLQLFKQ